MTSAEFVLRNAPTYNQSTPLRWILSHVRRISYLFISLLIGAFGNAALSAAVPVLTGEAFNAILESPPDLERLTRIALLVAGSQLVRGVLQFGRSFSAEIIAQRLERDIRDELYISLLGKSMSFHNLQPAGDIMARATNDVREVNLMFNPGINLVVGSANFLIIPLIVAPSYAPQLILVPAIFLVLYILALWQYLHELGPISAAYRNSFGVLNTHLSESIDGIEVVKGAAREEEEIDHFVDNAREYRDDLAHLGRVESRFVPLLLQGLATAGGFLHAVLLYQQGVLDVGQVVAYVGLIQLFGFPVFASMRAYPRVSLGMASARRILDLIKVQTDLDHNPSGYDRPMHGEVTFQAVDYSYGDQDQSLSAISCHIQPGDTVAVVGQTGSGKSTLAKLINRTHDVQDGQVLVDGVDVRDWQLEALRSQISIIEQDIFLFTRSLADNIAFGKPDATREDIITAAKAAQAHEFITGFADGYETVVGERGVTLSGGQRQRIALARAFLTDPRILILDDSTSAIDSATEDNIQRAIFRATEGRTTFIITHRLSQIRWADTILVLRNGRLAAAGTHEELMERSPAYRRIFQRGEV